VTPLDMLLKTLTQTAGCRLLPPQGLPAIRSGHVLPSDLRDFYERAGGAFLFEDSGLCFEIVPPSRVVVANGILRGGEFPPDLIEPITEAWYIIEDEGSSNYATIDLDPARLGRVYDSSWDRHGIPGSCPVIADSFSEFLERLLASNGQRHYWFEEGFVRRDAFDM